MDPHKKIEALASLLRLTLDYHNPTFPALVSKLAEWGDVSSLRVILDEHVTDATKWHDNLEVKTAIFLLGSMCPAAEREDARRLVEDWGQVFGKPSSLEMANAISSTLHPEIASALIAHGADPLYNDNQSNSPLYSIINQQRTEVARVILSHCVAHDIVPLYYGPNERDPYGKGVFEHLANIPDGFDNPRFLENLASYLETLELGPSCRQRLLSALFSENRALSFDPRRPEHSQSSRTALKLANLAGLDKAQWLKFLELGQQPGCVAAGIAANRQLFDAYSGAPAAKTIRLMQESGIDLDTPFAAAARPNGRPTTMLQCAAKADNAEAVQVLVSLGADPSLKTQAKGKLADAYALAPEGGAARRVLDAWRARNVMTSVATRAGVGRGIGGINGR